MLHLPSPALCFLVTNTAIIILWDTAVVLRVAVGDVGVATDTGEVHVGTNVPAHVVTIIIETLIIRTLHVVVADDLTLCIGGIGGTVIRALAVTGL